MDLVAISCGGLGGDDSDGVNEEADNNFVKVLRSEAPVRRDLNIEKVAVKCLDCGHPDIEAKTNLSWTCVQCCGKEREATSSNSSVWAIPWGDAAALRETEEEKKIEDVKDELENYDISSEV